MSKPIQGTIRNWQLYTNSKGELRCTGNIADHNEYPDGQPIITSTVVMVIGGMVYTQNSRYYLGKMEGAR